MDIIRVAPLASLPNTVPQMLDYFWSSPLPQGSLVKVTIGRRSVSAVVLESLPLARAKLAIKHAEYGMKKLSSVITEHPQLTTQQFSLARWLSRQYYAPLGLCLKTIAPSWLGKRSHIMRDITERQVEHAAGLKAEVLLVRPTSAIDAMRERIASARGTVLILVPEVELARRIATTLASLSPVLVHGEMGIREHSAVYRSVLRTQPQCIIGTRIALNLPYTDLAHVIVEDPLNETYKSDMAPRYNAADAARQLAEIHGAKLTWLSPALSTVQYHLATSGSLTVEHRNETWPRVVIAQQQTEQEAGHRALFSRAAQDALLEAYERSAPILIYSSRRGYATVARCVRCRAHIPCATCTNPMRWHRTTEDMLVCYHCATCSTVPRQCPSCHAGTLAPSGIPGSQKLAESFSALLDRYGYPKMVVPVLDSDLVSSAEDTRRVMERLDAMEHPVLVATSMIFGHRYHRTFDTIVVPHLDMLASSPDFRAHDRLILQLEKLADFTPTLMVAQTVADDGLTDLIPHREWSRYFEDELRQRKALRWPPYSRIVKLSYAHRDRMNALRAAMTASDRILRVIAHLKAGNTHIIGPAPALIERTGGKWVQRILIKTALPAERLTELLHHIPEGWHIDIDPRSIT